MSEIIPQSPDGGKDYPVLWLNIPLELRAYNSWINWQHGERDGKPTKLPLRSIDGRLASVTNPLDWQSFEAAMNAAVTNNAGIGFVFSRADPFCGIDLDATDDPATSRWQESIEQSLNSYSERSPSGRGLHVIVKAKLPGDGRRRGKIECYDTARFFTVTGNVYRNVPIADRQTETEIGWQSLGSDTNQTNVGIDRPPYHDDARVIWGCRFANRNIGLVFERLWNGDWMTDYGHRADKSQSVGDFELMLKIAHQSRNVEQTVRLFRQSALGRRGKAQRGNYAYTTARKAMPREIPTVGGWSPDAK